MNCVGVLELHGGKWRAKNCSFVCYPQICKWRANNYANCRQQTFRKSKFGFWQWTQVIVIKLLAELNFPMDQIKARIPALKRQLLHVNSKVSKIDKGTNIIFRLALFPNVNLFFELKNFSKQIFKWFYLKRLFFPQINELIDYDIIQRISLHCASKIWSCSC